MVVDIVCSVGGPGGEQGEEGGERERVRVLEHLVLAPQSLAIVSDLATLVPGMAKLSL